MTKSLDLLIEEARAKVAAMTPEEVDEMVRLQGESMARNYKPGPRQARMIMEPSLDKLLRAQSQQFQNVARN